LGGEAATSSFILVKGSQGRERKKIYNWGTSFKRKKSSGEGERLGGQGKDYDKRKPQDKT